MSVRGQGFEFIGGAIVPLGQGNGVAARMIAETDGAPSGAMVPRIVDVPTVSYHPPPEDARHAPRLAAKPIASKPMNVVREAKKRRAEIRKQLRVMRTLESELAQLDRLIKAAEQKPSPAVRSLTRSAS